MASPVTRSSQGNNGSGWSARQTMMAPSTVERKRKGRGADLISLPTPPQNRQNTQLPTPETIRHPRKTVKPRPDLSPETGAKLAGDEAGQTVVGFLPTPQTLPRRRTSRAANLDAAGPQDAAQEAPSPSGQTTFVHTGTGNGSGGSGYLCASGERSARRRPGLTFAQQMGLLSTAHTGSTASTGRAGVGVGMGGGHKAGNSVTHRPVDLIMASRPMAAVSRSKGDAAAGEDEENPFYVPPSSRRKGLGKLVSPRLSTRQAPSRRLADDTDEDEDMAGPSSPLAGRSPDLLHSPAHLVPPPQPNFTASATSRTREPKQSPALVTPSTPKAATSTSLPRPPAFQTTPRRSPRQLAKAAWLAAMRDEEQNPFLAKPGDVHLARPAPEGEDERDRPFVTYVFRGTRKVFANPFLPPDVAYPPALLDIQHEDYEDHPGPKPKLLWPTAPIVDKKPNNGGMDVSVEIIPSPPSSPIMRTPRTNRTARGRFLNADRSLTGDVFDPPAEVYTDSEDERERASGPAGRSGTARGRRRAQVQAQVQVNLDEPEEDAEPPVRRGLLFGPSGMVSAVKRAGDEGLAEVQGKKAKTLRV